MKIKEVFEKIKKKHQLQEISRPNSSGNFFTASCLNHSGEKFFVKIRKSKNKTVKNKFLTEIYSHFLLPQKQSGIIFPKIIDFNVKSEPEWVVRDYTEGETVGNWYQVNFKKSDYLYLLFKLTDLISSIHIPKKYKKYFPNKLLDTREHLKILENKKGVFQYLSKNKLKDKFEEAFGKISNSNSNEIFIHGDLTGSNIILKKPRGISVIDWFEAGYGFYGYDEAFLWFMLWDKPGDQKKFERILKKEVSKVQFELFELHKTLLAPKIILIFYDLIENLEKIKKQRALSTKEREEYEAFQKGLEFISIIF